jgi:putative Holliday junction resolvase
VRPGARLGIDVGSVRIGVACSDPGGLLATPVETVRRGAGDLARLAELARERDAVELVVGLPVSLSGGEGAAAALARSFAVELAGSAGVPVRLVDERLSTVDATRTLRESGLAGKRHRAVIDQAAAVIILQSALDAERATGVAPGVAVPAPTDQHADDQNADHQDLDDQGEA